MESQFLKFMAAYGLSQYRLHRLTGINKSQISEWQRNIHRPSRKSAARIALCLGLPLETVLSQIETREPHQNDISPTGEFMARQKKNRPVSGGTNDPSRTAGVYCLTCRRRMSQAA